MFKVRFLSLVSMLLLAFPGCIKTYKVIPSEVPQGTERDDNRKVVKNNIRSVRVYDQWETKAAFDALWMSDDVRKTYVNSYCQRRGKSSSIQETMLSDQLKKNKQNMSFYVLADVRDRNHPLLSDKNAAWTCYLELNNGKKIAASSVKEIDEFAPEIRALFGYRYNTHFKVPFLVKFQAINTDKPFSMIISSVLRECHLKWNETSGVKNVTVKDVSDKDGKLPKDEDFYWV